MLTIGIVGLPNVGKSTLFNSLTKAGALVANYPFATIEPSVGVISVPDDRLSILAKLYSSQKVVPATVAFTDIAGLVSGASKGEGLGNQFLSHIRSCQAIVQVVRAFDDSNIIHVDEKANPKKDIETINTELALADLQVLNKKLPTVEKEAKSSPKVAKTLDAYKKALTLLDNNQPLWDSPEEDLEPLKELQLLTMKPIIYVFNMDEQSIGNDQLINELRSIVSPNNPLFICAKLESELSELEEADKLELLASYGLKETGLNKLAKLAYEVLGLQSFLTAGEKEVRAWTIRRGSTAPQAAGAIHGDFERGFIAADVISFDDLVKAGSLQNARSNGKIRTEGKDYIVKPDDIIEFRFNV